MKHAALLLRHQGDVQTILARVGPPVARRSLRIELRHLAGLPQPGKTRVTNDAWRVSNDVRRVRACDAQERAVTVEAHMPLPFADTLCPSIASTTDSTSRDFCRTPEIQCV